MSKSRLINTSIWDDDYFADLNPEQKLCWFYILTNPSTELKPFFQLPSKKISSFRLGFDIEQHLKKFELDGKIKLCKNYILIVNWLKHQTLNDNQKKGIENAFSELDQEIKDYFTNLTLPNPSEPFRTLSNDSESLPNPSDNLTKLNLTKENLTKQNQREINPEDSNKVIEFLNQKIQNQETLDAVVEELVKEFKIDIDSTLEFLNWYDSQWNAWKTDNLMKIKFKIKDWIKFGKPKPKPEPKEEEESEPEEDTSYRINPATGKEWQGDELENYWKEKYKNDPPDPMSKSTILSDHFLKDL